MPKSHEALVAYLIEEGMLRSPNIIEAFKCADRKDFVPPGFENESYEDHPLPIGFGQTISQPRTVAFMLELLQPKSGEKILDVGSGSGWTSALLAWIVGPRGRVFGTEIVFELAEFGRKNLNKYKKLANVSIRQAEPGSLGLAGEAPFDRILVSAAASEFRKELLNQLRENGTIVMPIGASLWKIVKRGERSIKEEFPGFSFVPLKNNK